MRLRRGPVMPKIWRTVQIIIVCHPCVRFFLLDYYSAVSKPQMYFAFRLRGMTCHASSLHDKIQVALSLHNSHWYLIRLLMWIRLYLRSIHIGQPFYQGFSTFKI